MEISDNDLWILSYYRESELAGALIMGRLARETDDDNLRVHLTEHCAEEANHAWLWTRTILRVGGTPRRVAETYQSRYYAAIGHPSSMLEILALTQVFERRVMRHFRSHLRWPNTHPAVAETLRRMIADEVKHVHWVKEELARLSRDKGAELVARTLKRFQQVDRKVYGELLEYRERFRQLLESARASGGRNGASIGQTVRSVVAKSLGIAPEDLSPQSRLSDLGADSLDLAVIVMNVEEAFQVEFSPADAERLNTLADLMAKVTELRTAAGA